MGRQNVIDKIKEITGSNQISKFQDLVEYLDNGLGETIYNDMKNNEYEILNYLMGFARIYPKETLYIWHYLYNYITEKERLCSSRIMLATLYFFMASTLYLQGKKGYGRFYLKAYVEDIGFHSNYLKGGAIHALRVYCYLGQKGIELLDGMLMQATGKKCMLTLRQHIVEMSRSEFERLIIEIENRLSLEGNEYFFLPLSSIKELMAEVSSATKKKGNRLRSQLLEQLCQLLFGSVMGFRYMLDERSSLFQLDGLIESNSSHPFLRQLGDTIAVEAKQYFHKSKIARKFVDVLAMNMARVGASSAFFVTTASLSRPAGKEIYHNYLRTGKFIINITHSDIIDICNEKVSFPALISSKISNIRSFRSIR